MLIPGNLARVVQSENPSLYKQAVYFLANTVNEILALSYFYHRISTQISEGMYSGIDYEQARYSRGACFNLIVVNMAKLVETGPKVWNFQELKKKWREYIKDDELVKDVSNDIEKLRKMINGLVSLRHEKIAHQSKKDTITTLIATPRQIPFLHEVVNLMDRFVEGTIPYNLYIHDGSQEINLRLELLETEDK